MIALLAFIGGAVGWTFVEYWLHRGWGHRGEATNPFSVEHLAHHADVSYFAPTSKKLAGMGALGVIALPASYLTAGDNGLALVGGFFAMYVAYEVIHRRLHTAPGNSRYGRWARRHHLHHHYRRPKMNQGVTSPVWDFVFGTLDVPDMVRVPRRNALAWMLDANGELHAKYGDDYALVGRAPKHTSYSKEPLAVDE